MTLPARLAVPYVVIAPDSFKSSLDAAALADCIAEGIRRAMPDAVCRLAPMADGGEGTIDALAAHGGKRRALQVRDAAGAPMRTEVLMDNGAVIETATIAGYGAAAMQATPVGQRATWGLGDAIRQLLDSGIRDIAVGLGGSSTNDGGAGMLVALGARLYDAHGAKVPPTPDGLRALARIDASGLDSRLASTRLTALSDVRNPLCGTRGATAVFGPQKGVTGDEIAQYDAILARFATLAEAATGLAARDVPGAGAAGGLGFAMALLGTRFASGAETIAARIGLEQLLEGAAWLITGEGRSDAQTLDGKAPYVVATYARLAGVPTTLLSGSIDPQALPALDEVFDGGCFSIAPGPVTLADALACAAWYATDRAAGLARLFAAARAARPA
jgi:glycerate kinase